LAVLVLIDAIMMGTWAGVSRLVPTAVPSEFKEFAFEMQCTSPHSTAFTTVVFTFKALLIASSVVLAYLTRNVRTRTHTRVLVRAHTKPHTQLAYFNTMTLTSLNHLNQVASLFNDSHLIAKALYTCSLLCVLTIPLQWLIDTQPSIVFGLRALSIIAVSCITVAVLFIPKLRLVFSIDTKDLAVQRSSHSKLNGSAQASTYTVENTKSPELPTSSSSRMSSVTIGTVQHKITGGKLPRALQTSMESALATVCLALLSQPRLLTYCNYILNTYHFTATQGEKQK
jgi:hypothetical protein